MLNMKTAKCSCNVMNPISERQQYEINLVVHQDESSAINCCPG